MTTSIAEANRDWRAADWGLRFEVRVFVPLQTERVDDVEPELGRALDLVAQNVALTLGAHAVLEKK